MSIPARPLAVLSILLLAATFLALLALTPPGVEAAGTNTLSLPAASVAPGQEITVTLVLTYGAGAIYSADIRVTYDPALLTALRVTKGSTVNSASWSLVSNVSTAGLVQAGLATGGAPLAASGDLLYLTFRAGSQIDASTLTLTAGSLNEGEVPATLQDGSLNVNTAPVARGDGYTTAEDTPLTVAAPGVSSNDSDADSHALTASIGAGPSHGQVRLAANGGLVYTPTLNYFGVDTFTYAIADGHGGSATATVNLTVTAVNDLPTAQPGGPYSVNEGGSVALDGGASSDVEDAGDSLTYEWDLDANGSFETIGVTPTFSAAGQDGPGTASVRLRVRDTQAGVSPVTTATVTIQNVAPTANPGGPYTADAESSIQLTGAGSSDPGGAGDPLTYGWDWGNDGSVDATGVQPTFSTAGMEDVTITVGLQVTDDESAASTIVTTTLRVLPLPRWGVAGQVHYWKNSTALPNVRLDLQGFRTLSATNESGGAFTLANVPQGAYTLTASKSDQANGITAYDAALTLRHVSGAALLSGYAALAANANQQAGISALDASLILQKSVGLIPLPFPDAANTWVFSPTLYTYATLAGNQTGQDFSGILLGDVSGNWSVPASRVPSSRAAAYLALDSGPIDEQGNLMVTVRVVRTIPDLFAVETTIAYDPARTTLLAVEAAPPAAGWMSVANATAPGRIAVAAAGATALPVGSSLAALRLNVRNCQPDCGLAIAALTLNEQVVAGETGTVRAFLPVVKR